MKIISFALCLAAVALVAVEAAPGSVGSHFRARMIRDKSLLQKRDPNSKDACEAAKKEGYAQAPKLNTALQGFTESGALTKVRAFQQAMIAANGQQDDAHYQAIKAAYGPADAALAASSDPKAAQVREEAQKMMDIVNKIAPLCK